MAGFTIHPSEARTSHSVVWIDTDKIKDEPLFVVLTRDGGFAVATGERVRDWADQIHHGEADQDDVYKNLYIRLPGGELLPCAIRTRVQDGVLWCDIVGIGSLQGHPLWSAEV